MDKKNVKPEKEVEIRNIPVFTHEEFVSTKKYLCEIKADFKYIIEGSVERLEYGDRSFFWVDMETSGGRGHHLGKMFKKDVDNWLKKNKPPAGDANYKEQMFHLNAIEEVIGEAVMMVDINDCYWRTAFLLGYITEETYIKGLRKKEWKIGRNACIGSLCKTQTIVPFVNGEPVKSRRKVVQPPIEYQHIRNHIINHVYNIFNYMFQQMGYTFYMFLTDCIVFRWDKVKYVEKVLHGENYRFKLKTIEFTELDRANKKVSWIDFGSVEEPKPQQTKYYQYSDAQVVYWQGIRSDQLFFRGKEKGASPESSPDSPANAE